MSAITAADLPRRMVDAIRQVTGDGNVALHEPTFAGNEWAYLKDCLDSTFVSSVGAYVNRFERALADYTGAEHVVAVVNGTAALHMALLLAGVERDDEVLVPALTFVATAAAVMYVGAVPHFVDSEMRTLGLDPAALRDHLRTVADVRDGVCINRATGRRIKAVVPMHTFGHPVDLDALLGVCRDFALVMVEDSAESLGSRIGTRHTGTYGLVGILSFNGNKTITTGGGGAVLTGNPELAARARHLTTTAKVPHAWAFVHDAVGYNYRLPNINAALGCAQVERLGQLVDAKRSLYERYSRALAGIPEVQLVREPEGTRSNYWLQAIVLDESVADSRDALLAETNAAGVMTRPLWTPMHRMVPYADCPRMALPVAESLSRRLMNLPSSAHLADKVAV